jgi:predicted phage terminase large subunit-like protein
MSIDKLLTPEQKQKLKEKILSGEVTAEDPAIRTLVAKTTQDCPLEFARKFLSEHMSDQDSQEPIPSPPFHKEMTTLALTNPRVAIAAPRGHAKSTSMTFFYPLYMALYEKKKFIVIISASEDSAKKFLRRIRNELEANQRLLFAFGHQKTDKWSETELRLQNGATIIAKGRGAQMRGLISGHTRPDLIILDDLEDDELVRSQLRRLDLEDWFNGAVMPTLAAKSGSVVYVGTILHEDSLLNRLLNKNLYPDFKTKKYAAIQDGASLWPEHFSLEELERKKAAYIARDKLANFYMEYLNDPIPQESAVFKPEFFQYFEDLPPRNELVTEVFIDLGGGSTKKSADPTAMVVLCLDKHNTIFINDYINDKMGVDTKRIANAMFELYGKYKPSKFTIEKTVASNMIQAALNQEMIRRGIHLNVEYVNPTRGSSSDRRGLMSDGKYQRIAAMQAAFKLGVIKMRPWMTDLKEQLQAFPRATHDDLTDALAYGYLFMKRRIDEMEEEDDDLLYEPLYPELGI